MNIANPNTIGSDFSADKDADHVIRLTATSDSTDATEADTLSIELDSGLLIDPRSLTFCNDITTELDLPRDAGRECSDCHQDAGGVGGVPVWWAAIQPSAPQPVGTPSPSLYEQAMTRVMPEYIEDSQLLKKPSGRHHYGRQVVGFDTSLAVGVAGRASYDLFVNWIAEGAKCGIAGATKCP